MDANSVVAPESRPSADRSVERSRQLVIAGFHRSGTSMTGQWLSNAGLPLGTSLLLPDSSNTDGHFEDADIVELHDDMLGDNRSGWQFDGLRLPEVSVARRATMLRLADDRTGRFGSWGFKDPRACLFLRAWFDVLENPYVLIVYRDFNSCAASLRHRASRAVAFNPSSEGDLQFWQDPALALRMWLAHNRALVDFAVAEPERVLVVGQRELFDGYPLIDQLNRKFGFHLDALAPNGVRPSALSGTTFAAGNIDANLAEALGATWADLEALSKGLPPTRGGGSTLAPTVPLLDARVAVEPQVPTHKDSHVNHDDPEDVKQTLEELRRLIVSRQHAEAVARLRRGGLPRIPARILLAQALLAGGHFAESEEILTQLQGAGAGPAVPVLLSSLHLRRGQWDEAVSVIAAACDALPMSSAVWATHIRTLHRAGHPETALAVAISVSERFSTDRAVLDLTTGLLHLSGRHDEGDALWAKVATSIVSSPDYQPQLAAALARVPDPHERTDLRKRVAGHVVPITGVAEHSVHGSSSPADATADLARRLALPLAESDPDSYLGQGPSTLAIDHDDGSDMKAWGSKTRTRVALEALAPWHFNIEVEPGLWTRDCNSEAYANEDHRSVGLINPAEMAPLLKKILPGGMEGKSFLDAGCNGGGYCFVAHALGARRTFGFDVREHWINQANYIKSVQHPTVDLETLEFQVADAKTFALRNERFDVTLFKGIFYHLPDPISVLRDFCDVTDRAIIVDTVGRSDIPESAMLPWNESKSHVMSGVDGLAWFPGGPAAVKVILEWAGFPYMRIVEWKVGTPEERHRSRFRVFATRDETDQSDYDGPEFLRATPTK